MESLKRSLASLRRGALYLWITCEWNPSKGVWHPSERGTIYLCITHQFLKMKSFNIMSA